MKFECFVHIFRGPCFKSRDFLDIYNSKFLNNVNWYFSFKYNYFLYLSILYVHSVQKLAFQHSTLILQFDKVLLYLDKVWNNWWDFINIILTKYMNILNRCSIEISFLKSICSHRGFLIIIWTGIYIKIGIVQKEYEWPSWYFAKMVL